MKVTEKDLYFLFDKEQWMISPSYEGDGKYSTSAIDWLDLVDIVEDTWSINLDSNKKENGDQKEFSYWMTYSEEEKALRLIDKIFPNDEDFKLRKEFYTHYLKDRNSYESLTFVKLFSTAPESYDNYHIYPYFLYLCHRLFPLFDVKIEEFLRVDKFEILIKNHQKDRVLLNHDYPLQEYYPYSFNIRDSTLYKAGPSQEDIDMQRVMFLNRDLI